LAKKAKVSMEFRKTCLCRGRGNAVVGHDARLIDDGGILVLNCQESNGELAKYFEVSQSS
jgi:hypothetical protein